METNPHTPSMWGVTYRNCNRAVTFMDHAPDSYDPITSASAFTPVPISGLPKFSLNIPNGVPRPSPLDSVPLTECLLRGSVVGLASLVELRQVGAMRGANHVFLALGTCGLHLLLRRILHTQVLVVSLAELLNVFLLLLFPLAFES